MDIPRKNTMVCVTVQRNCDRLIRHGATLSSEDGLHVVHVVKSGGAVLGARSDGEALDFLYRTASAYGAEMDMLRSDDVVGTIADFAARHAVSYLVIGASAERGRKDKDIEKQLQGRLPGVRIFVIP